MVSGADKVVAALRRTKNRLDDPAIRDALRDSIAETMPVHLMELLELDMPEIRTPKPKTFTSIMIQNKPERKFKKPIGNDNGTKPIGFAHVIIPPEDQTLSCVGFQSQPLPVPPENTPLQNEYIREREIEQAASNWDESLGEFIRPTTRTKPKSAETERVRGVIQAMQR